MVPTMVHQLLSNLFPLHNSSRALRPGPSLAAAIPLVSAVATLRNCPTVNSCSSGPSVYKIPQTVNIKDFKENVIVNVQRSIPGPVKTSSWDLQNIPKIIGIHYYSGGESRKIKPQKQSPGPAGSNPDNKVVLFFTNLWPDRQVLAAMRRYTSVQYLPRPQCLLIRTVWMEAKQYNG